MDDHLYYVVVSLVPPGRLLQPEPSTGPDVREFSETDPKGSTKDSLKFTEEINFKGLPGKQKVGLLIQLRHYNEKDKKKTDKEVGWAFLSVFSTVENENTTSSLFLNSTVF